MIDDWAASTTCLLKSGEKNLFCRFIQMEQIKSRRSGIEKKKLERTSIIKHLPYWEWMKHNHAEGSFKKNI